MKNLGKLGKELKKPRTLLLTVSKQHEARMIPTKNLEFRDNVLNKNVHLKYSLTKEETLKESLCLKRRRELLSDGVPRNVKVDLEPNDFADPKSSS